MMLVSLIYEANIILIYVIVYYSQAEDQSLISI